MKRVLFVVSAALLAAALANPVVESISNTGVFGSGFVDRDQSSVGPTLAIAALLAVVLVVARTIRALDRSPVREYGISSLACDLARRSPASDLPWVAVLQFAALYAMERAECFAHGGTENGFAWLGGPLVFAVAAHAVAGVSVTLALGRALRFAATLLATIVTTVLDAILAIRARSAPCVFAWRASVDTASSSRARGRATRGRAPPLSPTLA